MQPYINLKCFTRHQDILLLGIRFKKNYNNYADGSLILFPIKNKKKNIKRKDYSILFNHILPYYTLCLNNEKDEIERPHYSKNVYLQTRIDMIYTNYMKAFKIGLKFRSLLKYKRLLFAIIG